MVILIRPCETAQVVKVLIQFHPSILLLLDILQN